MKQFSFRSGIRVAGAVAALSLGLAAVGSAQQVSLTLRDGRVTLKTENATARQILDEWARVGRAKVVNADKVTGPPLTLTLIDVPEDQALDTVLRAAAGYTVLARANREPNASVYDRIFVMARVTPVSQTASAAAAPAPAVYTPPAEPQGGDEPVAFAENEPPQPTAPVVNPYGNANGVNANAGAPGGGVNSAAPGTANSVNVRPPETRFDYTNPQAYFEQQRRAAQAAQAQGIQPAPQVLNPYPGSNANPIVTGGAQQPPAQAQPQPTGVPTLGTGTTSQPGMAPTPQPQVAPPPTGQGGGFNPYNMNPYNMPPNPNPGAAPPTTPVEPDRAKYANPYAPTKPPQ